MSPAGDTVNAFLEAMKSAGVHMDLASPKGPHPIPDGQLHRANALGKKNKKNMHVFYVLHLDGVPAGAFGDLATGVEDTWCAKKPSSLTDEERRELKERMKRAQQERAEKQAEMHKAAAEAAALIMKSTGKADPSHPYLAKKGLPVFPGLRVLKSNVRYTIDPEEEPKTARAGNLVVPMFSPTGDIVGAQIIQPDGTKRFIKGTAKEGNYHSIGKPPEDGNGPIIIAEGYATAARLHEATGFLTIAAFDAGNLLPVAKAIRKKYGAARIIFAADNDRFTKVGDMENPGVTKAREAADQVKGRVAVPIFEEGDITSTDFDDLAQLFGLERVRSGIEAVFNAAENEAVTSGRKARRKSAPPPSFEELGFEPQAQKKQIKVVAGAIDKAVDAAIAVLTNPKVGVFARGEDLVRVVTVKTPSRTLTVKKEAENIRREEGSVIITPLSADAIVDVLTAHADFVKYDRRAEDWLPCNCPIEVARTVMARKGHGWTMPRLRAIISAPTMRHDGTVIAAPGYDAESGLLLTGDDLWREIQETPSKRDALDALDVLVEPLRDFPFVANSDRAASVALLITAVLRPTLRHAPMFAITAPAAGTGKSKIIDIAAIMATGRKAAVITPTPDEAELEKRIGASAIEGDQVMALDNVTHVLKSDQLCQMLTAEEVKVRVLGQSKAPRIPSTALICATGNNISIHGDLNRRTVVVRMDAGCERPEEREFPIDAVDVAKRRRTDLVAAALTIVRAFLVAGAPRQCTPLGGFEDWSEIVRSALIWLDYGDCLGDVAAMRGEDPEKQQLAEVLDALPSYPFTTKEISRLVGQEPELRDALSAFLERNGVFAAKRFGRYLARYKGTIVGNLRVEVVRASPTGVTWQVKRGE
jgi:putative DNA primase/helicase